jgi:hypothetical protein
MTWQLARDTIVAIPSAVNPSFKPRGFGDKFLYDKTGNEQSAGTQSRRYWARIIQGNSIGPSRLQVNRHQIEFEITVEYIEQFGNTADIDIAIGTDYEQLTKALTRGDNWNRPASKIIAVNAKSSDIAKFKVDQIDGARRLRVTLTVEYES